MRSLDNLAFAGKVDRQAATKSTFTRRPNAFAARDRVCSVTAVLSGSSKRSRAAREVPILRAISDLLRCLLVIRSESFRASARLSAASSTSSRIPSPRRKSSRLLPRCGFCLWVFCVGIFSFKGQRPLLRWSFLGFLDEAVDKNDFLVVYKEERSSGACGQARPHLPQAVSKAVHQRHAEWPAKLYSFQILTDGPALALGQGFEPLAYRFVAARGSKEEDAQWTLGMHKMYCIIFDTVAKLNFRLGLPA
jgi:hypothetical protein